MSERPELRLVRERLESVLSPSVAGAALFEALGEAPPPTSARATLSLVEGPLLAALGARIGGDEARHVVDEIATALAHALNEEASGQAPRGDTTLEIPVGGTGGLSVIVVSETDAMARQLEGALGSTRICAIAVRSAKGLELALGSTAPGVVIVDAARFAPLEPAQLAATLASLPRSVLRAIWGSDLPYGAATIAECARLGTGVTSLDRREGIAPLVDLVRART